MDPLKAKVINGQIQLDEPTELPEGTELLIVAANHGADVVFDTDDDLDDEEREQLHASLRRGLAQARSGDLIPGDEVVGRLLNRG